MVETKTPERSLHRKLAQVMYEAERIPKNGRAPKEMGGYPFVQVGDAADYIRKALAEKVITMMPTAVHVTGQQDRPTKSGGSMTTVDLVTEWTLTDGESGESITIMSFGSGADGGDKYSGKASTSAMKYALLTGFLLSTGEDTEGSAPERQHPGLVNGPNRPELERRADGLQGVVAAGKPPVDLNLRETPDGWAWGFKLTAGRTGYQALATGPLAEAMAKADVTFPALGKTVTVWGRIEMVPWDKGGKPMPPFARIAIERVSTPDWVLPAEGVVAVLDPDDLQGVPTSLGESMMAEMFSGDPISDEEAAAIIAQEAAEAAAG